MLVRIAFSFAQSLRLPVITCLIIAGCNELDGTSQSLSGTRKQIAASALSEAEIKAAWGIDRCHIGMTIDECINSLGEPDKRVIDRDAFADGTMSWYDLGLMVVFKDSEIVQVYFKYLSQPFSPFPTPLCSESDGSDPKSAVTAKFGSPEQTESVRIPNWQPDDVSEKEKEYFEMNFAGRMQVWYDFPTQGIDVCFVDERVEYVRVYIPERSTSPLWPRD